MQNLYDTLEFRREVVYFRDFWIIISIKEHNLAFVRRINKRHVEVFGKFFKRFEPVI